MLGLSFPFVPSTSTCAVVIVCDTTWVLMELRRLSCRALLQRMAPEHVFSTAAKLCADVLGGAADGGLDLAAAGEVVGDALRLLASKHMKARWMRCPHIYAHAAQMTSVPGAPGTLTLHLISVASWVYAG